MPSTFHQIAPVRRKSGIEKLLRSRLEEFLRADNGIAFGDEMNGKSRDVDLVVGLEAFDKKHLFVAETIIKARFR